MPVWMVIYITERGAKFGTDCGWHTPIVREKPQSQGKRVFDDLGGILFSPNEKWNKNKWWCLEYLMGRLIKASPYNYFQFSLTP